MKNQSTLTKPVFKFSKIKHREASGRILFSFDPEDTCPPHIQFYCGPEEDGHFSDRYDNYDEVTEFFKTLGYETEYSSENPDSQEVEVGAAENLHLILKNGKTYKDVVEELRPALIAAGAIEFLDP